MENYQLASAFSTVASRLSRLLDRRMAEQGASLARTRVLTALTENSKLRAADIAELLELSPRTITDTLNGMEKQGLITRETSRQDRRAKTITLTKAGGKALANSEPARRELIEEIFGSLSASDGQKLAQMLEKLSGSIEKAENPPS